MHVYVYTHSFAYLPVRRQRHHVARELVDRVPVRGDALLERRLEALVIAGGVHCISCMYMFCMD